MPTVFSKKIENATTIAAGAVWSPTNSQLSEDTEISKFLFFNHLTVFNNSSEDIDVRLYGTNITDKGAEYCPAGATLVFDKEDDMAFGRPAIYNRGTGIIAINQIILQIRKVI